MIKWLILCIVFLLILFFVSRIKKNKPAHIVTCSVGKFKVIALFDGHIDVSVKNIINDGVEIDHSYFHASSLKNVIKVPINVYLVDMGFKVILVDAGFAGHDGSSTGLLMQALAQAGYTSEQITDILITHLHVDHVAGLLTKDGQKAFVNAQLHLSKEDVSYWIYEQELYPALTPLLAKHIMPYALHTFTANQKIFEGVSVVSTPGHSPGHSSFLFESEKQKLLILGDIVHIPELQFEYPHISLKDDTDQIAAIKTRKDLFAQLSSESILVGGAHLPFPGLGYVQKSIQEKSNGYIFVPFCR